MSRWTKNIVVPLESLCKEKENTNRPTVTRSVGTVGKWGKMGFTSTRTYALSGAVAAAAAAVASSPSQSPASALEDDLSPSVPEPAKPKKFFKSRSIAPPEVIVQYIAQNLPRHATSPIRDNSAPSGICTPSRETVKMKTPKSNSAERKKKQSKKSAKIIDTDVETSDIIENNSTLEKPVSVPKIKKKKEEKKLKPEAAPSRIIPRARKAVNYCEDYEEDRLPTPIKDYVMPKGKDEKVDELASKVKKQLDLNIINSPKRDVELPPPASKTPEHPPIVLRISKGTSRLVSTDSEDLQNNAYSPHSREIEGNKSRKDSVEEGSVILPSTPKIIVKPPRPPSPEPAEEESLINNDEDTPEINYCTVKISPDKPPKERLKLIIKTDVIRNALAKAAAASAAKAALAAEKKESATNDVNERPEKEKKQKSKKHKHLKLVPPITEVNKTAETFCTEFKTPSPHPLPTASVEHLQQNNLLQQNNSQRTILSPSAVSEKDFDSQSSILGSISSKGNQTPLAQANVEESCVLRSRGSSVITSDLDSSQHSSLLVAPSDIESRLEVMMMSLDGGASQRASNLVDEQPLQEDILAVLRGDDSELGVIRDNNEEHQETNGIHESTEENQENININIAEDVEEQEKVEKESVRRITRGRGRIVSKGLDMENISETLKTGARSRTRKTVISDEAISNKRATRRTGKKEEEQAPNANVLSSNNEMQVDPQEDIILNQNEEVNSKPVDQEDNSLPLRRVRSIRNVSLNNNFNNNNNNINKIAASLSAKAGAVEDAKVNPIAVNELNQIAPRTYGRKRKNQQVTQVIQPSAAELVEHLQPTPAKIANIDLPETNVSSSSTHVSNMREEERDEKEENEHETRPVNLDIMPPLPNRDYQIKDKFKRTLTLDPQANCNAIVEMKSNNYEETQEDEQRGAVKLVISKKKGSIFKSRALVTASDQHEITAAKRYLYKHRWDADANGGIESDGNASPKVVNEKPNPPRSIAEEIFNDFDEDCENGNEQKETVGINKFSRVTKSNPQGIGNANEITDGENDATTGVKVDRKTKEFYMVVRNVKTAHQIQEIGEYQEMDDDVEYILDALQSHNPTPTRCLSALQLATKCMIPAFRMHVRAHGIVTKFFKALSDANTDLSLGLCTSAVMFILSQEGLNMDLDRDSLELMINLLEAESVAATPSDRATYERNKHKVRELCEEIKAQGKAAHLNVDTISVGTLAMETLLSLTSKRAGEWFKEELRELGGLEHIIKTISECCRPVFESNATEIQINWTPPLLENLQTVERCLRVLENVTEVNEENQKYMLTHAQGGAIKTLCLLYNLCERQIMLNPTNELTPKDDPGVIIRSLLISVLKVLVKLTHSFFDPGKALGAELLGKQTDILDTSYHLLLRTPNYIPERCVFELSILVLLLLMNLTIYTIPNRKRIIRSAIPPEYGNYQREKTAVEAIMEYFYKCEELARLVEKNTDAYLDNTEKSKKKQEEVDETVNNLLQKAGHHMEHTLKGSFAAILIGQLITDSDEYESIVRNFLRNNGFQDIIAVLEKYYSFMNLTASSEATTVAHIKETKKLIDYFKKRDMVYEMDQSNDNTLPLNLEKSNSTLDMGDSEAIGSTSANSSSAIQNSTSSHNDLGSRVYKTYSQR